MKPFDSPFTTNSEIRNSILEEIDNAERNPFMKSEKQLWALCGMRTLIHLCDNGLKEFTCNLGYEFGRYCHEYATELERAKACFAAKELQIRIWEESLDIDGTPNFKAEMLSRRHKAKRGWSKRSILDALKKIENKQDYFAQYGNPYESWIDRDRLNEMGQEMKAIVEFTPRGQAIRVWMESLKFEGTVESKACQLAEKHQSEPGWKKDFIVRSIEKLNAHFGEDFGGFDEVPIGHIQPISSYSKTPKVHSTEKEGRC